MRYVEEIALLGTYTEGFPATRTGTVITAAYTTAKELTAKQAKILHEASVNGVVELIAYAGAKTTLDGSNYLTISKLTFSRGGTYYNDLEDHTDLTVNALGFQRVLLTGDFPNDIKYIKFTNVETGSMNATIYVAIRCMVPNRQ